MTLRYNIVWVLLFMSMVVIRSHAHDPDKAYFDLFESEKKLVIKAEFPWSIRNALIDFRPPLEQSKSKEAFENALLDYLRQNIIITDTQDKPFQLQKITEYPGSHSHSAIYMLVYDKFRAIKSIENASLFNLYDNQINYHQFEIDDRMIQFETTPSTPQYYAAGSSNWFKWTIGTGAILFILFFLFLLRRR